MKMHVSTGYNGMVFLTPSDDIRNYRDYALTPQEALTLARDLIEAAMAEIRLPWKEAAES